MINWDKIDKKVSIKKVILPILIIILILVIVMYSYIIKEKINKNEFIEELVQIAEKNKDAIFKVEKIYLCSSANAEDSEDMQNINIYQYTDIAIYINNFQDTKGLENVNTIKELYIDNISIEANTDIGTQSLNYINLYEIGSKESSINLETEDIINFKIISTNEENDVANYSNPTYYTDCSNPITLRYVNKLTNTYSMESDNSVSFDGTLLSRVGISTGDINCKLKFKINIVNNENQNFSCWINFKIPLEDILDKGTTIKNTTTASTKYNFFAL